jgi:hypothetical protein
MSHAGFDLSPIYRPVSKSENCVLLSSEDLLWRLATVILRSCSLSWIVCSRLG